MKTMDAGRAEVEYAAKAGANVVGVLGAASDATIRECIEAGRNYGAEIIVDMIQVDDVVARAQAVEAMGASYVGIHVAIDEQMEGKTPFETLRQVAAAVSIPVAVAGGINSQTAAEAVRAGASIVVVGGAVTKATDAAEATRQIKHAIAHLVSVESEYFVRATAANLAEQLLRVSTANVSDALHRSGDVPGLLPRLPGREDRRPRRHRAHLPGRLGQAGGGHRPRPAGRRHRHRRGRRRPRHLGRARHALGHPEAGGRRGHLRRLARHPRDRAPRSSPCGRPW